MSGQSVPVSAPFDIPGRIKCGTVVSSMFDATSADYRSVLGLTLAESGTVPADLAASWGAPASVGKRYGLFTAADGQPGYLRVIDGLPVTGYRPLTTYGWAAYELTVADCDVLFAAMPQSSFTIIGEPKLVPGFDNFIPFQVSGAGGEVLYLNQVLKGSMADLDLPHTKARVDHMFIAILAAGDREAALRFHIDALGFAAGETYVIPYSVINKAFGLPDETTTAMTMTRSGRLPGSEIDQYPAAATPRATAPGELPPGNAMISFIHADLDRVAAPFITPPVRRDGPLYGGRRTACVIGAAGELIELIEAE